MIRMHVQADASEIYYHGARMSAEEYLNHFSSQAIPGFVLNLERLRRLFQDS